MNSNLDKSSLTLAKEAYKRSDWKLVLANAGSKELGNRLHPDLLEMCGLSHLWLGNNEGAISHFDTAFDLTDIPLQKVRLALQLWRVHSQIVKLKEADLWLERGKLILDTLPHCREHIVLEWVYSRKHLSAGRIESAKTHADKIISSSARYGYADLELLGKLDKGHCLLACGNNQKAGVLHKYIFKKALNEKFDVQTTGTILASVIWGHKNRGDWRDVGISVSRFQDWCKSHNMTHFLGLQLLHEASYLRMKGDLQLAKSKILRACELIPQTITYITGDAYSELGEILFRLGEVEKSLEAFEVAKKYENDSEPGYSTLLLKLDRKDEALRSLERAIASRSLHSMSRRVQLVTNLIIVQISRKEFEIAKRLISQLDENHDAWSTPSLSSEVLLCKSLASYHEGYKELAQQLLDRAILQWDSVEASYEIIRAKQIYNKLTASKIC